MSNSNFPVAKRLALAFSGIVYIFAAPFVAAEGAPFIALWIMVGFGLFRQMLMAISPTGFRHPFPNPTVKPQDRRILNAPRMVSPIAVPGAA